MARSGIFTGLLNPKSTHVYDDDEKGDEFIEEDVQSSKGIVK